LLAGPGDVEESRAVSEREDEGESESGLGFVDQMGAHSPASGRLAALEDEVSELRSEVERLRADLDDLKTQLGS
jgi:hypothetical protein